LPARHVLPQVESPATYLDNIIKTTAADLLRMVIREVRSGPYSRLPSRLPRYSAEKASDAHPSIEAARKASRAAILVLLLAYGPLGNLMDCRYFD